MVGYCSIPKWLDALLKEDFFENCLVHGENNSKNHEKKYYCFDCCSSVCPSCLFRHRKHVILQVRRYVYHDVLRLSDAQKLMDCSGIQGYITNSSKVVFLKERPLSRVYKGRESSCFTCNRNLQDPFIFCCLSCKVKHIVATKGSLELNISSHKLLSFSDVDEYQMTPNSVLDSPGSIRTSSGSGSASCSDLRTALLCTATTEIVRKKRSNLLARRGLNQISVCSQPADNHLNRRKRAPNRSPMC